MKTNGNHVINNLQETQTKTINNWMESTQKFQKAVTGGTVNEKSTEIYNDWLQNQMSILKGVTVPGTENTATANTTTDFNDFYKNWLNAQMGTMKQSFDSNQNLYNTFLNFGKPVNQVNESFTNMNSAWSGIYNNWMKTINHSYENMAHNMPSGAVKDAFTNIYQNTNLYVKMQEIMEPIMKMTQNGNFNMDSLKNMFDMNQYKQVTEKMFAPFFANTNQKEFFEEYTKKIEAFFAGNSNTSKEYFDNYQAMLKQFPTLVSGDFAKATEFMEQFNNQLFGKTFEPLMKLVNGKDKEKMELLINTLDKAAAYNVKNTQMQYLIYTTGQKAAERSIEFLTEKAKTKDLEITNFQTFYNEWLAINEKIYTEFFASDEFSAAKSELLSLSLGVKKDLETQFEVNFETYPIIFRTEMDELYKTIHDLKRTVKDLESKLAHKSAATLEFDEEDTKTAKSKKK